MAYTPDPRFAINRGRPRPTPPPPFNYPSASPYPSGVDVSAYEEGAPVDPGTGMPQSQPGDLYMEDEWLDIPHDPTTVQGGPGNPIDYQAPWNVGGYQSFPAYDDAGVVDFGNLLNQPLPSGPFRPAGGGTFPLPFPGLFPRSPRRMLPPQQNMIPQQQNMGTPSLIPSFAQGGDFITDGPQTIMVGEGGPERVQVQPLSGFGPPPHTPVSTQVEPGDMPYTQWPAYQPYPQDPLFPGAAGPSMPGPGSPSYGGPQLGAMPPDYEPNVSEYSQDQLFMGNQFPYQDEVDPNVPNVNQPVPRRFGLPPNAKVNAARMRLINMLRGRPVAPRAPQRPLPRPQPF
jgi:hypothetical protein